jgi:hypothetical protein
MMMVAFRSFLGNFPNLIKTFKEVGVQDILTASAVKWLNAGF